MSLLFYVNNKFWKKKRKKLFFFWGDWTDLTSQSYSNTILQEKRSGIPSPLLDSTYGFVCIQQTHFFCFLLFWVNIDQVFMIIEKDLKQEWFTYVFFLLFFFLLLPSIRTVMVAAWLNDLSTEGKRNQDKK